MTPTTSEPRRLAVTAVAAAAVAAFAVVDPERVPFAPPCPTRTLTGLDCPGCGSSRCLYDLANGNLAAAFDHNPMTVLLVPVLLTALIVWWVPSLRRPWMGRAVASRTVTWMIVVVTVAFAVVRNTPTPLGRYLAST